MSAQHAISSNTKFRLLNSVISLLIVMITNTMQAETQLNVEELRLSKVQQELPDVLRPLVQSREVFQKALSGVNSKEGLKLEVRAQGTALWQAAVRFMMNDSQMDDRPLYWERLYYRKLIKEQALFKAMSRAEQTDLLWHFELNSRGQDDLNFKTDSTIKILITGFDPFFLDRNLDQSNPSGVTALYLDNQIIELDGKRAEIQALIVPVRYDDFDLGMIETLLAPYYEQVDMIVTISMGRKEFDIERFPGLRRSVKAPDNLNVYTGASKSNPIIPKLNGEPLDGPEFVEFSLPITAMQAVEGKFQVNDNPKVVTLESGQTQPESLAELAGQTAVSGSGGGYLSNEVSYRSIRLRNYLRPELPVGHIHTPRIKAFEPDTSRHIAFQIKEMLRLSLITL